MSLLAIFFEVDLSEGLLLFKKKRKRKRKACMVLDSVAEVQVYTRPSSSILNKRKKEERKRESTRTCGKQ